MKPKGVLGVDDTLLTHYDQDFEQIAKLFDHITGSHVWAHDLVTLHYSAAQHDPALCDKLQYQLKMELEGSAAFPPRGLAGWRRTTQAPSLWNLALFISAGLAQGQTLHQFMAPLRWSRPVSGSQAAFDWRLIRRAVGRPGQDGARSKIE
jgi:hypothetical protein